MRLLSLLLVAAFLMISCRSQELIRPGDSLQVAYDKAYGLYENERWMDAANAFETVISIGRGTSIGQDAQYFLAESYFNAKRYILAAAEYERYSSLNISSPRREEVDFKIALSYYHQSPRYKLDQTYTRRAIESFRLFRSRYPSSDRTAEAGEYIDELRNKLARKQFAAGEFYMRTNRYNAAVVTYSQVIEQYPESEWAERSLVKQIESYILYADNSVPQRQAERYRSAIDSYETYLQLFPRGENRERVEELYERALDSLEDIGESVSGEEDQITATNP